MTSNSTPSRRPNQSQQPPSGQPKGSFTPDEWIALADIKDEARRTSEIMRHYLDVADWPEEQRLHQLTEMVRAEHQKLPEEKLLPFTRSKLLAVITMDQEKAKVVVAAINKGVETLPATLAMRRVGAVQTVARDLSPDQIDKLYVTMPSLVREMPRRVVTLLGAGIEKTARKKGGKKKPFWKFWG